MASNLRPTEAVIDLANLAHNTRLFRSMFPKDQFFCPMVKANGYGHGAVEISRFLEKSVGIQTFGVSLIEEGLQLRNGGVQGEILTFGLFDHGARELIEAKLTPVVSTFEQLEDLAKAAKNSYPLHVKVDSGMGRLGFSSAELPQVVAFLEKNPQLKPTGLLTHFHSGEDAQENDGHTYRQLALFANARAQMKKWQVVCHVWNTASLISLHKKPEALAKFGARPGLGLYGVSTMRHELALKPVMSLRSKIAKLNSLLPGQSVSYGATWTAKEPSLIGVVPVGYADGVHRLLSNIGVALVEGQRVPFAGRVCMDYVMLDLTKLKVKNLLNAEVTFFGHDSKGNLLSAFEVAELAQTAPWEIFTSVSSRVPRRFISGESR